MNRNINHHISNSKLSLPNSVRHIDEITDEVVQLVFQVWSHRSSHPLFKNQRDEMVINRDSSGLIASRDLPPLPDARHRDEALEPVQDFFKRNGSDEIESWTDYEWGLVSGKLSAIRWMLGDEWDLLDP